MRSDQMARTSRVVGLVATVLLVLMWGHANAQVPARLTVSAYLGSFNQINGNFVVTVSDSQGAGIDGLGMPNFELEMFGCGGPGERPDSCGLLPLKVTEVKPSGVAACVGCYVVVVAAGPSGQFFFTTKRESFTFAVQVTQTRRVPATVGGDPTIQVVAQGQQIVNTVVNP
jgi:hypothetical protein